ncbi:cell death specification protein 2-like [Pomacea canaliculata]|uniref:cell death specification protein 2-like n=1 Tax=Pomacea canaliculata TaxID=400727 RepID=UPI000D73BF45|nr:cell death specification protein 2-like [Pomacea canaliculata]
MEFLRVSLHPPCHINIKCWQNFPLASLAIPGAASSDPTLANASLKQVSKPDVKHTRAASKPIPTEMKDAKYNERRKLNNLAAKWSRDLCKQRMEEQVICTRNLQEEQISLDEEERVQTQRVRDLCILLYEDPEDIFRKAPGGPKTQLSSNLLTRNESDTLDMKRLSKYVCRLKSFNRCVSQ